MIVYIRANGNESQLATNGKIVRVDMIIVETQSVDSSRTTGSYEVGKPTNRHHYQDAHKKESLTIAYTIHTRLCECTVAGVC